LEGKPDLHGAVEKQLASDTYLLSLGTANRPPPSSFAIKKFTGFETTKLQKIPSSILGNREKNPMNSQEEITLLDFLCEVKELQQA